MLCSLSQQFPAFVEGFLDQSRQLRRRFREESVTDILMGGLITAGGGRIIVDFPDEPATGADMEWNFVNPYKGKFFRILLQAKQCFGKGNNWKRHNYRHILHTTGNKLTPQAEILCNTARTEQSTYPLYILYNPKKTCLAARKDGATNVVGACLADGYKIERLVKNAKGRALRTRNKNLRTIAPLLFPLSNLFCPPNILPLGPFARQWSMFPDPIIIGRKDGESVVGIPIPPTPQDIRQRIVDIRGAQALEQDDFADIPGVPEVSDRIPKDILSRIRERGFSRTYESGLQRWRVTFVSGSPRDAEE